MSTEKPPEGLFETPLTDPSEGDHGRRSAPGGLSNEHDPLAVDFADVVLDVRAELASNETLIRELEVFLAALIQEGRVDQPQLNRLMDGLAHVPETQGALLALVSRSTSSVRPTLSRETVDPPTSIAMNVEATKNQPSDVATKLGMLWRRLTGK